MSAFPPLSSLPPGLGVPAGVGAQAAAAARPALERADEVFGFSGSDEAARALSVPPSRGDGAAQLEARFLDCLFVRG